VQQSILQIYAGRTGADVLLDTELVYTASGIFGQPDTENNSITLRGAYKNTVLADGYMYTTNAADADLIDVKGTAVAYNVNTEKAYSTLTAALMEGLAGQTVKLLTDLNEAYVMVPFVTLDLNGHTLTAVIVTAPTNDAHIIDSSEENTGRLVVAEANLGLNIHNKQIAIYTAEGYIFADATVVSSITEKNPATGKYSFGMAVRNADRILNDLMVEEGPAKIRVEYRVRIDWIDDDGNSTFQTFSFSEEMSKEYAAQYGGGRLTLNVSGLNNATDIYFTAQLVAIRSNGSQAVVLSSSTHKA
jgi:hypothetical protein